MVNVYSIIFAWKLNFATLLLWCINLKDFHLTILCKFYLSFWICGWKSESQSIQQWNRNRYTVHAYKQIIIYKYKYKETMKMRKKKKKTRITEIYQQARWCNIQVVKTTKKALTHNDCIAFKRNDPYHAFYILFKIPCFLGALTSWSSPTP